MKVTRMDGWMDGWTDGRTDRRRARGRIGMIGKAASYSLFGAAITKVRATRRDAIDRSIDRFFTENLIREKEGGLARVGSDARDGC